MLRIWGDPTMLGCLYSLPPPPQTATRMWLLGQLITGCRTLRRDYFETPVSALFRVTYYE